jgi:MFS family permease
MLELLKDRVYLRYWLAVVVSFLGDAMTRVTLVFLVARLTHSAMMIAVAVLAQLLPSGVLAAFIGPVADRVPKRVLLVGSDLARIAVVLAMIPARHTVWALIGLMLAAGVGKAFFETARIAAVPKVVGGPARIPVAIALFQSTYQSVNLLGPAVAGVLIGAGTIPVVFALDAATFLVSALLLGSLAVLREMPAATPAAESYWSSMGTGIRGVLAVPSLRVLLMLTVPVTIVYGLFTTNVNAEFLDVFNLSGYQYGLAQALLAGGAAIGALGGPALIKRFGTSNGLLLTGMGLFGLAMAELGPTQWLWHQTGWAAVLQWCLLTGLFAGLFQVPIANTLLTDMPDELRGRGVGLLNAITVNFTIVGVLIGGAAASWIGIAGSIVVPGLALAAFTAVAAFVLRSTRSAPVEEAVVASTSS